MTLLLETLKNPRLILDSEIDTTRIMVTETIELIFSKAVQIIENKDEIMKRTRKTSDEIFQEKMARGQEVNKLQIDMEELNKKEVGENDYAMMGLTEAQKKQLKLDSLRA